MKRSKCGVAAGVALFVAGGACPPAEAQVGTVRASLDSSGGEANGTTAAVGLSADGRFVVLWSFASNLCANDGNATFDVFVRDRLLGTTDLVSANLNGDPGNDLSLCRGKPAISADGRFVVFLSWATDLVANDVNGCADVFVRDRLLGTTELVSVSSTGTQANQDSFYDFALSADGRFVAFVSPADDLVAGDAGGWPDVFVRDRWSGTTELVSVASSGAQSNGWNEQCAISADGRYVAMDSLADNLAAGDANQWLDVFVHDRQSGTTELVSVDSNGVQGPTGSSWGSLSSDGRFVAFVALDPLAPGDTNGTDDVYVRDRQLGTTELVSVDSSEAAADRYSNSPCISGDGRTVAFASDATNLVAGDTNLQIDVFVRDRAAGTTTRASVSSSGSQGNAYSGLPFLSADGRSVAFGSSSDNLVAGDANGVGDAFVRGPHLTLAADPLAPGAGAPLTFTAWTGQPSAPEMLTVVDVDGTALFAPVMIGSFDGEGGWTSAAVVPPGLSGLVVTVQLFGIVPTGKVGRSNAVVIAFQ